MWLEMLDDALHGEFAPGQAALADARDALVGVHDDKKEVARAAPDGQALDVCDLHGAYSLSLRVRCRCQNATGRHSPRGPSGPLSLRPFVSPAPDSARSLGRCGRIAPSMMCAP